MKKYIRLIVRKGYGSFLDLFVNIRGKVSYIGKLIKVGKIIDAKNEYKS